MRYYVAFDFQVENTPEGYVVSACVSQPPSEYKTWRPLRNFGDRQGDAIRFKTLDCPKLNEFSLKNLINDYNSKVKYIRVNSRKLKKQSV